MVEEGVSIGSAIEKVGPPPTRRNHAEKDSESATRRTPKGRIMKNEGQIITISGPIAPKDAGVGPHARASRFIGLSADRVTDIDSVPHTNPDSHIDHSDNTDHEHA